MIEDEVTQSFEPFYNDLTQWLSTNRHVPHEQRLEIIKSNLKNFDNEGLLNLASMFFLTIDVLKESNEERAITDVETLNDFERIEETDRVKNEALKKAKETVEEYVEFLQLYQQQLPRTLEMIKGAGVYKKHFQMAKDQRITANARRVEKFNEIKDELKNYWTQHIKPDLTNTHAAKILENTAIYKNFSTKLERTTLARYVGEWKKERQELPK